jgi:hypothetical protein
LLSFDLSFEYTILMSVSLAGLFQLRNFYLKIFDVLFFALTECALRSSILRLAFLKTVSDMSLAIQNIMIGSLW